MEDDSPLVSHQAVSRDDHHDRAKLLSSNWYQSSCDLDQPQLAEHNQLQNRAFE